MPRPLKKRFVCCAPFSDCFTPKKLLDDSVVNMTVDEYEAIRLIDFEECTQEECAEQMHVSRTTVQGIYDNARKKIAESIVCGRRLVISGGDYVACNCYEKKCGHGCQKKCHKHKCGKNKTEEI